MKTISILFLCCVAALLTSCVDAEQTMTPTTTTDYDYTFIGDSISIEASVIDAVDLQAVIDGYESMEIRFAGRILHLTPAKTCLMRIELSEEEEKLIMKVPLELRPNWATPTPDVPYPYTWDVLHDYIGDEAIFEGLWMGKSLGLSIRGVAIKTN